MPYIQYYQDVKKIHIKMYYIRRKERKAYFEELFESYGGERQYYANYYKSLTKKD